MNGNAGQGRRTDGGGVGRHLGQLTSLVGRVRVESLVPLPGLDAGLSAAAGRCWERVREWPVCGGRLLLPKLYARGRDVAALGRAGQAKRAGRGMSLS